MDIRESTSKEAGSCNACSFYHTDNHVVYEINLKTLTFRLCVSCAKELIEKLKDQTHYK
jgi:hypothetical protein